MGLSPDALLERNPKLVIVRISGWGQAGPYSRRPGFGTLVEAMSGFASMNGFRRSRAAAAADIPGRWRRRIVWRRIDDDCACAKSNRTEGAAR